MTVAILDNNEYTTMRISKLNRDRLKAYTTIDLDKTLTEVVDTLDKLADYGTKKESFPQIADRLIAFWEQNHES